MEPVQVGLEAIWWLRRRWCVPAFWRNWWQFCVLQRVKHYFLFAGACGGSWYSKVLLLNPIA